MAGFLSQIAGIIETCKSAMIAKHPDHVDKDTFAAATALLKKAKQQVPNDKALAAVTLECGAFTWGRILSAMQIVEKTVPIEQQSGGATGKTSQCS
jgi:hypothetical protein